MSLTVLGIVQAAISEVGLPIPTSIISTTDTVQIQARNIMYAQSRQLRNRRVFPQAKKSYGFSLVSGQYKYPLPEDYYAATTGTQWDDDTRLRLLGPLSDSEFTYRTKGLGENGYLTGYRIFGPDTNPNSAGGQFQITPTPAASGEDLSYEYITKTMFLPPNWTPLTAGITTGNYRNANGNIYKCTAITTGTTGSTAPSVTSGTEVDAGVTWTYQTLPYEAIILDTDLSLFDDDIMIAGFKWRFEKAKKLDWESDYESYTTLLDSSVARYNGSFVGRMDAPNQWTRNYAGWRG